VASQTQLEVSSEHWAVVLEKPYLEQLVALERVLEKALLMSEMELKMELVMFPRALRMLESGSHRY
jgi:hypothetical protein